jgi:hypothetical protein
MALEAGEVMHQVFATTRIWQLYNVDGKKEHALIRGQTIFGYTRWNDCMDHVKGLEHRGEEREHLLELCFAILNSTGWKDDPNDPTRTMQNMQLSTIAYVDHSLPKMENWPIYVSSLLSRMGRKFDLLVPLMAWYIIYDSIGLRSLMRTKRLFVLIPDGEQSGT